MNKQQGYLLVVEDVPDILVLLNETLKFKGYRVITAHNGLEALDIIQQERPALIITDILMPKMDGFSLVHRLRLNPETRDIPVIFLSATYVAPEDKAFALTIGVTRFIEKPVDLESFFPVIDELLAQKERTIPILLDEISFYEGYRKRLETKLKHKNTQIARDENLLKTLSGSERASFEASLRQSTAEREEIQHLLEEIRERLENLKAG
ncbi:MAG: response regulator [Chloroflexi bacterium]|nr:response regulator [Chloroflexota bacterium]